MPSGGCGGRMVVASGGGARRQFWRCWRAFPVTPPRRPRGDWPIYYSACGSYRPRKKWPYLHSTVVVTCHASLYRAAHQCLSSVPISGPHFVPRMCRSTRSGRSKTEARQTQSPHARTGEHWGVIVCVCLLQRVYSSVRWNFVLKPPRTCQVPAQIPQTAQPTSNNCILK